MTENNSTTHNKFASLNVKNVGTVAGMVAMWGTCAYVFHRVNSPSPMMYAVLGTLLFKD